MVTPAGYGAALRSLWEDRCTVRVKQDSETPNGRTVQTETVLFAGVPCRLSQKSVNIHNVTQDSSHAALEVQSTVLLLDKALNIPAGSTIFVTHEGITHEYVQSGVPARYSVHQEIPVELKKEWA